MVIFLISIFFNLAPLRAHAADETPHAEAAPGVPSPWPSDLEIDRADGGTLFFRTQAGASPSPLKTSLTDIQPLGLLKDPKGGIPYVLVTAPGVPEGAAASTSMSAARFEGDERMVYLMRADGARFTKFVHPGKVKSRESGETVLDSRAFFGQCLAGKGDVYVVHQREKVDRRRYLQVSVFIAEPGPRGIQESLLTRRLPLLDHLVRRARKGTCTEIAGITRKTSPPGNPNRPPAPPPKGEEPGDEAGESP